MNTENTGLLRAKSALEGKKALVIGLASTGIAASRFLKKCGVTVIATDSKPLAELPEANVLTAMGIDIKAGGHPESIIDGVNIIVVSPGVPYDLPILEKARSRGIDVISDIELACRFIDCQVLAIAGTNGKTTTTTLLGEVLEAAGKKVFVGGNIGTPAVEYVESGDHADYCVLEISSFHLETTKSFSPHIGILLNITEDHLDRYRDFDHYAETKFRLFENQSGDDYAVVNADDRVISKRIGPGLGRGKIIPFSSSKELNEGLSLKGGSIIFRRAGIPEEAYPAGGFKLKGLHNIENIMAVIAAARIAGVSRNVILDTASRFAGLSHRMEFVMELEGVRYIDDSKGTNIGALMMALKGLKGPVVLIAGGRDKGGDYSVLSAEIKAKVKALVLLGEARMKIKESLGGLTRTILTGSLEEAVRESHGVASPGDTVLLCPACSSFDMFKSYKDRGDRFKALVKAL